MSRIVEHEQLRTEAGPDLTGSLRDSPRVPSAEEVRALVEGPPPSHQIRWMRWLGALLVVGLGLVVAALVMQDEGTDTVSEFVGGQRWFVSAQSAEVADLPIEPLANPPDDAYVMVVQTPHGVSFEWVTATQTPHGVSIGHIVSDGG
jgi:hypothetical protein